MKRGNKGTRKAQTLKRRINEKGKGESEREKRMKEIWKKGKRGDEQK